MAQITINLEADEVKQLFNDMLAKTPTPTNEIGNLTYVYSLLPTAPVFSNTQLLNASVALNSIEPTETSKKTDLLVQNPYTDRLRPNGLVGTASVPYRIKSESDTVYSLVGGDKVTASQQVIGCLNSPDYVEFYHLMITGNSDSKNQPGITGIQLLAKQGGSHFVVKDTVIKDMSFAGVQSNSTASAGTVASLDLSYIRVFGYNLDGEGFYLGNTSKTDFAVIQQCSLVHSLVTDKGRDGIQFNNHANLYVNKCTVYDVGKANLDQQRALLQVQNSNGLIENSLLFLAPEFCTIGTHGLEIRNCYFYANARGYINKASGDYPGSPMLNGKPIIFRNCHFGSPNKINEALRIMEDGCDIQFINCTKDSNITNLFLDNRLDKTSHNITEVGTSIAASVTPTFLNLDPLLTDTHGVITTPALLVRGIGYRSL